MANALRVFIVLLLLSSGGALYFGHTLFQQREQMKGRTQKQERAVLAMAQKLTAQREPYIEAIPQKLDPNALMTYTNMDKQLTMLQSFVDSRLDDLFNTKDELKKTKDELTKTQQELAQTKQELETARKEIVDLKDSLAKKEAELAQAQQKIAEHEAKIAELNQTVASQKEQIAKLDEDILQKKDEIVSLQTELLRVMPADTSGAQMKPGLTGKIVVVNPEWNFVVLNIGIRDGISINGQMLVHRSDKLVGRVRIVDAGQHIAIANIQRDWTTAEPIQEGDSVLNPN